MLGRIRHSRDPFWDDGKGARKTQRRLQIESLTALAIAIAACGLTAALWLQTLAPLASGIRLN